MNVKCHLRVLIFTYFMTLTLALQCTVVNGVKGACKLDLNHFTLAGSHNSGAGAYGTMRYWINTNVAHCFYHNQHKSITAQLQLGIRYFDFDVAYIKPSEADGSYWEAGTVIVHSDAYSRALKKALLEIDNFLGDHPDDIVVIRMKDHPEWARSLLKSNLGKDLEFFTSGKSKVKLSSSRNPILGHAIESNERIVMFINGGFGYQRGSHFLAQIESYKNSGSSSSCYGVNEVVNRLKSDNRIRSLYYQVQVDWFYSYGLCNWELSGLCDEGELYKLKDINKKLIASTNRPVNLVSLDYVGRGNVRLADVVRKMNENNVKTFA